LETDTNSGTSFTKFSIWFPLVPTILCHSSTYNIAKISKYIGCDINYNEEKTLSDENFSGLCSREVYLNVKELRSKKARGMHLCKNERAYLNRWGDLFS